MDGRGGNGLLIGEVTFTEVLVGVTLREPCRTSALTLLRLSFVSTMEGQSRASIGLGPLGRA